MDDELVKKIAKLDDGQFSLLASKVELLAKLNKTGAGYIPEGTIDVLIDNIPKKVAEEDSYANISKFSALSDKSYMSPRFLLKQYMGLTDKELAENEKKLNQYRKEMDLEPIEDYLKKMNNLN